jgi:RNA polymerase sigma-70 factor (ECF subfamily)
MDDEQELIRRLREGDKGTLETVIKLHHAFLVAMATPLIGCELADDVAQETWLKVFAAIGKFEGRSKLRTWLARIAINEAHAMRRKTGREVSLEGWGQRSRFADRCALQRAGRVG